MRYILTALLLLSCKTQTSFELSEHVEQKDASGLEEIMRKLELLDEQAAAVQADYLQSVAALPTEKRLQYAQVTSPTVGAGFALRDGTEATTSGQFPSKSAQIRNDFQETRAHFDALRSFLSRDASATEEDMVREFSLHIDYLKNLLNLYHQLKPNLESIQTEAAAASDDRVNELHLQAIEVLQQMEEIASEIPEMTAKLGGLLEDYQRHLLQVSGPKVAVPDHIRQNLMRRPEFTDYSNEPKIVDTIKDAFPEITFSPLRAGWEFSWGNAKDMKVIETLPYYPERLQLDLTSRNHLVVVLRTSTKRERVRLRVHMTSNRNGREPLFWYLQELGDGKQKFGITPDHNVPTIVPPDWRPPPGSSEVPEFVFRDGTKTGEVEFLLNRPRMLVMYRSHSGSNYISVPGEKSVFTIQTREGFKETGWIWKKDVSTGQKETYLYEEVLFEVGLQFFVR